MEIVCDSYSEKHKVIYKWKIHEIIAFIESTKNDEGPVELKSSNFTANGKDEDSWYLQLNLLDENGWISLYLCRKDGKNKKDDLIPNNTLTVGVGITVYDDYKSFNTDYPLQKRQRKITDDLKELYDSKINSDVILVVGNEKFKAHKFILSTRSPV
ncbi:TD and POZ domain-containing protein 1-like [Microplitis demolitor]|uniref:TD and POZ domain-containing protein 1-like n=1 Tax=Microplitis demolitor TaxID=69319 RepID=UPI00235B6D02|nr:TD and POZ domain-containing protein 1-like [Microplitis demolitor]